MGFQCLFWNDRPLAVRVASKHGLVTHVTQKHNHMTLKHNPATLYHNFLTQHMGQRYKGLFPPVLLAFL